MKKILYLIALACLLLSGCTVNPERVTNLEGKIEAIENRLSTCENMTLSYETRLSSVEQRQGTLEGYYQESIRKHEAVNEAVASLSNQDIQTALRNAGFYSGPVDGKIGPDSERAIRAFQKANNLKVDGIAGAKTKSLLSKYLGRGTE